MKRTLFFWLLVALPVGAQSLLNQHTIRPLIGSGSRGDGGAATEALLDGPYSLAEDLEGNVYISESNAGIIRRVRPDGTMERFAGTGKIADGLEGRAALETDLLSPTILLVDQHGGLLFSDAQACRIRKVQTDRTIRDIVGTGLCSSSSAGPGGFPGGGGNRARAALETEISIVGGMTLDPSGRLVFSDPSRNVVRRLDTDGFVRTIAGAGSYGFSGDTSLAIYAQFRGPAGLAYDDAGNLYIADESNCRIRRVDSEGVIDTVAGNGTTGTTGACASASTTFSGGVALRTSLGRFTALAYDRSSGSLVAGSPSQARVLRYDLSTLRISPFLGNGRRGASDTNAPLDYSVDQPNGFLASSRLGVLVADSASFHVLQVQAGAVTTFAGYWPQLSSYPAPAEARLLRPRGLCVDSNGSLLVVDAGAERLLSFTDPDQLAPFAGQRYPTGYWGGDNGPAGGAQLNDPDRVACSPSGEVYLTHGTRIRVVDRQGVIQTIRQNLNDPSGLVIDSEGRLLYSEAGAHRVVRYDFAAKTSTVIAGTGTAGFSGDGGAATSALLNSPGDLALDSQGNLLIADRENRRVRRVSPDGTIQTIAGSGRSFSYADFSGEPATVIGLDRIGGMTVDANDNLYIAESLRVSIVGNGGRIHILTGFRAEDDDGARSFIDGPLNGCDSLAVDRQGRLYISLREEGRVVMAAPLKEETK